MGRHSWRKQNVRKRSTIPKNMENENSMRIQNREKAKEEGLIMVNWSVLTVDSGGSTAVVWPVPRCSHRCLAKQGVDTSLWRQRFHQCPCHLWQTEWWHISNGEMTQTETLLSTWHHNSNAGKKTAFEFPIVFSSKSLWWLTNFIISVVTNDYVHLIKNSTTFNWIFEDQTTSKS